MFEFWLKFNQSMFLRVKLISFGSDDGFMQTRRQAIIWTNDG